MLKIYLILLAAAVTSATQDKPLAPLERVLEHATEAGYVGRRRGFFDIFDNMLPGTKFRKAIERMNPDAQDVAISLMQKSGKSEQEVVNMIYRMTEDLELRPRGHDTVIFKQRVDKKLKEIEFNKRFGWPGLDACDESEETLKKFKKGSDWGGRSIHDLESPFRIDDEHCPKDKTRRCHNRSCDPRGVHSRCPRCHLSRSATCSTDYDCNGAGPDGYYSFKYYAGEGLFGIDKDPGSGMPDKFQWIRQACVMNKCKAVKGWSGPKGIGQSCSGDFYESSTLVPETRCARGSYCQPSHHICVKFTG